MDEKKSLNDRLNLVYETSRHRGPGLLWETKRVALGAPVNWSSVAVGDVVTVPMAHTGLKFDLLQKLYVRQACIDLFKFLSETPKNMLLVTGCPGVGKSIEVFSFALEQAQLRNKRVLYIHGDIKSGISVIYMDDPAVATARVAKQIFSEEPEALNAFIDVELREGLVDLVVLDGALSWLILRLFLKMDEFPKAQLVTCTSFQAPGRISQEVSVKCAPRARFVMDSWQEDELYAAVDAGALSMSPGTTPSEMFYYAGGSVRLFLMRADEAITEVENKIRQVPDMGKLVGSGGVGDSSDFATNSLMAIYGSKTAILSQFATRSLMGRISDDFIQKARRFWPGNPAWQGWLFEAEVIHNAGTQKNLVFLNDRNDSARHEVWEAPAHVTLFRLPAELVGSKVGWFQPTLWNQKGYDALFRASSDKLRIVQISTSAKSRKFNLEDAIPLAQAMNVQDIEIVLLCGEKTFRDVKISESDSGGREALTAALKDIVKAKKLASHAHEEIAREKITFRTVCYQLD